MTQPKKMCEVCFTNDAEFTKFKGLWLCRKCRRTEEENLKIDRIENERLGL